MNERLSYQRQDATEATYARKWQQPTADRPWIAISSETLAAVNILWAKHFGRPIDKYIVIRKERSCHQ